MAVLVDTCGWIEWLTDGVLAEPFRPYLEQTDALIVPTVVQYELYKWVRREKDHALALQVVAWTEQSRVVPLSTALALYAADLALEHKLAFADATIYATARQADAPLITADNHFEGLPEVTYLGAALLCTLKILMETQAYDKTTEKILNYRAIFG